MSEHPIRTKRLDLNRLPDEPAWPTKRRDVYAALTILQRHAAQSEPLRLLEAWGEDGEERIWVQFPAWMIDLAQHFQQRSGDHADRVLQRVLNELLPLEPLY